MEKLLEELKPHPLFPGIKWFKHKTDGFVYTDHLASPEFWIKIGNNFKARESDIYIASQPRAGTTWTTEFVYLLANDLDYDSAKRLHSHVRNPYLNFPDVPENCFDIPSPRVIRTHIPYAHLPESIKEKKCKIIYAIRNPKDTLVSFFNFAQMIKYINYVGDFNAMFELFVTDELRGGPYWKHVLQYWERRNEDNFLMDVFEERIKDPHAGIRKIAKFLGKELTDEQVRQLAEHCSFDSMRSNPNVNMKNVDGFDQNKSSFIRKGKVGDWRNYFSQEQSERMDEYVKKHFSCSGLEFIYE